MPLLLREATGTAFRLIGIGANPLLPLARQITAILPTPRRRAVRRLRRRSTRCASASATRRLAAAERGRRRPAPIPWVKRLVKRPEAGLSRKRRESRLRRRQFRPRAAPPRSGFRGPPAGRRCPGREPRPPRARRPALAAFLAIVRPRAGRLLLTLPLALLRRLVHRIEDAEIVLGVLEVALRHHPVAAAGRVAAKLEVLLEQLLRRPADAQVRTVAVEDVVAIERDTAAAAATVVGCRRRHRRHRRHRVDDHVHAYVSCSFCCRYAFSLAGPGGGSFEMRAGHPRASRGCAPRPGLTPSALVPAGILSGDPHSRERWSVRPSCLGQAALRLALPEGKLDCRTRTAKRFFHGESSQSTNARGFPVKSCRAATVMPAIRPRPAIVSSCPGPNSTTAMPVGPSASGAVGTSRR